MRTLSTIALFGILVTSCAKNHTPQDIIDVLKAKGGSYECPGSVVIGYCYQNYGLNISYVSEEWYNDVHKNPLPWLKTSEAMSAVEKPNLDIYYINSKSKLRDVKDFSMDGLKEPEDTFTLNGKEYTVGKADAKTLQEARASYPQLLNEVYNIINTAPEEQ